LFSILVWREVRWGVFGGRRRKNALGKIKTYKSGFR
jgi:hypothetical protein